MNEPGRLAQELVDCGFSGMKVWPFDLAAEESGGSLEADLSFGLGVLSDIREAVGSQIDLYVELHSLWRLEAGLRLIEALEPFDIAWVEDPIRADDVAGLRVLRDAASMQLAVGENVGAGSNGYPAIIQASAVDTLIMDLGWCGGLSAALPWQQAAGRVEMMTAFHDCTGPVSLAVATHMSLASEFTSVQEIARAFAHDWYPKMADGLPEIIDGRVAVSEAPGHGVTLSSDFLERPGTAIRSAQII